MRPEHLVRLAERLCDRSPEVRVVGVHADRWPGGESVAVNGDTFPVRWCISRLAVSQQLSTLAEGERLIVVTPLTDADLGLDVLARLARRRLLYPEPWQMVRDAYGVSSVDPRLPMQTWMADALLGARPQRRRATPDQRPGCRFRLDAPAWPLSGGAFRPARCGDHHSVGHGARYDREVRLVARAARGGGAGATRGIRGRTRGVAGRGNRSRPLSEPASHRPRVRSAVRRRARGQPSGSGSRAGGGALGALAWRRQRGAGARAGTGG